MERYVVMGLSGGLGNQLLQYASGLDLVRLGEVGRGQRAIDKARTTRAPSRTNTRASRRVGLRVPGLHDRVVVGERGEVVAVGAEADKPVGADREHSDVPHAQLVGGAGVDPTDASGPVVGRGERHHHLEPG